MEITANIAGSGFTRIEIRDRKIESVCTLGAVKTGEAFVSPGFVDIQVNGFAGVDFSDPELTAHRAIYSMQKIWETGVTTFCATLITNTIEQLERNFRVLEEARRMDARFAFSMPGYHLEGPYLSPGGAHGAHNPEWMRCPDWDQFSRLQAAAGNHIAIVTLAPELRGASDFIRRACAAGVIVAIGHTDGSAKDIHSAIAAGATLSTHLGNGCPAYIHRHKNSIWSQIASDQLLASVICDGFHLPRDFVRTVYKAKGIERCILVTDAVHVAGLPPGEYSLAGTEIRLLPSGKVVTADRRSMAGSSLSMNRAVTMFRKSAGASLQEALQAATTNPGKLLGLPQICTAITQGQPANLITFRPGANALHVERVLTNGEEVYRRSPD